MTDAQTPPKPARIASPGTAERWDDDGENRMAAS
jgi:hypothetical protein